MSSYLFPSRLDRWAAILQSLHTDKYRTLPCCRSGGGHMRIKELISAGLVHVSYGRNGGYQLSLPLSAISLSRLLAIFPRNRCSTLNLLYRYADMPLVEIMQSPPLPKGRYKASVESVSAILLRLHVTRPTFPDALSDIPYSVGYVEQVLASLVPYCVVKNHHRKGKVLIKPFDEITVGDIAPVLAHRGHIHSTIISRSTDVKLIHIQ